MKSIKINRERGIQLDYITEIKAFYDRLELNSLSTPAIALWHGLMYIANKSGWQSEFTVAVSILTSKTGLNAQAIKRARNELEQKGLIVWRSRKGNQSAVYQMISLQYKKGGDFVPQIVPQIVPQTVPQVEPQIVPINRHRRNETKEKDANASKKKFAPPTLEEVEAYCKERGNTVDAAQFIDFYASKGWLVGKVVMKDWKAAVRTWERNRTTTSFSQPKQSQRAKNRFNDFPQRQYSDADLLELERRLLQK